MSFCFFLHCIELNAPPKGLAKAEKTGGPRIIHDLNVRPFPEVPFPNDLATIVDPNSPTGIRVNISKLGGSKSETKVREYLNQQFGFGVFTPITISFDRPLDVHAIIDAHHEPEPQIEDDVVFVINVDKDSPEYGQFVELDLGRGNFPVTMAHPERYFDLDPRAEGTNLVFESVQELDLNNNGILDPIEDSDDDGVWDKPNTLDDGADPIAFGQMLDFYERESNTLIMRPVKPLAPGTTYAVVLTKKLTGADGKPVESPFTNINHTRHTPALEPLRTILPSRMPTRFTKDLSNIRFTWSFTTGEPTWELRTIRAGLYGHGPLSWLNTRYPAHIHLLHTAKPPGMEKPLTFKLDKFIALAVPIITQALSGEGGGATINKSFDAVDYVVSGSFLSPNFLVDKDGLADPIPDEIQKDDIEALNKRNLQDDDESMPPDLRRITFKDVGVHEVPFLCIVPKPTATQKAPFPTIIYSHAIRSTRFEMMAFAGIMSKFGLATCAIEAMGHGLDIPQEYESLLKSATTNLKLPHLYNILQHHRARDLNNDGKVDVGSDYFTANLLHSRDNMRQTTIDQFQLIRILRSFDGKKRWPDRIDENDPYIRAQRSFVGGWDQDGDGVSEIAGDFNADGVFDFGGDTTYASWGTSLGGLQSSILAGADPTVRVMASNSGGGGISDISIRARASNVRAGVMLRMMGPLLIGTPAQGGTKTHLSWILPDNTNGINIPFASVDALEDGDRIVVRNLVREKNPYVPEDEKSSYATVRKGGTFRLGIAADAELSTARRARLGFDARVDFLSTSTGCTKTKKCGEDTCSDSNICHNQESCVPLRTCMLLINTESLAQEAQKHVAHDPTQFGDALIIEIYDAKGVLKHTIDTFEEGALYHNIYYPKGSALAALSEGWGLKRQTPKFRQLIGISQTLLEPADPAVWASHYTQRLLSFPYEREAYRIGTTHALIMGTLGDQTVPISAGLTLARTAGILDTLHKDDRLGMTPNQFLVQNYVYEGIPRFNRFPEYENMLFDPDDLDRGAFRSTRDDRASPEANVPLRATISSPYFDGVSGLRLSYLDELGAHTFNLPNSELSFDIHLFMLQQTGWYLATGGRELRDDPCFEEDILLRTCSFYDPKTFKPNFPLGPVNQ